MMEIDRFKGGRGYVHATDELLAAEPLLSDASRFIFTSRKVGTCVAHWQEIGGQEGNEAHLESIARLITEGVDGSRRAFECRQDVTRPITAQASFDEDALARPATFDEGVLICPVSADFTLWEYLSTLQKILLQKHIGHPQWYFVRLELKSPAYWPPVAGPATLTLRYRQQKGPLFLSDVEFDGHMVGEIGFAKH
jgi:hypothetical protein